MGLVRRVGLIGPLLATLVALGPIAATSTAQFGNFYGNHFELSGSVHVDEVDAAVKQHLERVRAFLEDGQWDEAVETLRQVMESPGTKVVPADRWRYVGVREYCQLFISRLPPDALALYRQRVDPEADSLYAAAMSTHDPRPLEDLVDRLFCSSKGDDALLTLGEFALEGGDAGAAQTWWDRLIETPPLDVPSADYQKLRGAANLADADALLLDRDYVKSTDRDGQFFVLRPLPAGERWSDGQLKALARVFREHGQGPTRLTYPGSDIPLADVRARQVLLSILEAPEPMALSAFAEFARQYPDARGRLGGRETNMADALAALLKSREQWPAASTSRDWPTFAGAADRNKVARGPIDIGSPKWKIQLPKTSAPETGPYPRRIAEDRHEPLSYHPAIVGDLLLINNQHEISAFSLKTGQAAWQYEDIDLQSSHNSGRSRLGVPRHTLTVHENKVYARMGSPVTSNPNDQRYPNAISYLICLDVAREGSAVWDSRQSFPLDDKWAFEGSPICDGPNLYVALRRSDVHPQAHVACLDATTGKLRWQRWICSAETPAQGQMEEVTHNLLCLHSGVLYYNTNLGAVAAVDGRDGRIKWIRRYPRAQGGDLTRRPPHFYRDLNPCIYDNDTVFAAPSDSPRILAIEAGTGQLRWETTLAEDTIHLLGVSGGNLIATGDKIWWFNIVTGKPARLPWPMDKPGGFGRGMLADGKVYWPTRERVYVFDAHTGDESRAPIEMLRAHNAGGGNLVVADGYFLAITSDTIYGFETPSTAGKATPEPQAARASLK